MRNCKNIYWSLLFLASAALLASCSRPARISVEIKDAPASEVVLCQQNVNRYDVLDTVKTDDSGKFTYKVRLEKGDPDFVYVYRNGIKLASLLLSEGDKVAVVADTSGHYKVSGSGESEKLQKVEHDYSVFSACLDSLAREMEAAGEGSKAAAAISGQMAKAYTDYYRQCVRYVMANSRSLTVVPVFYQTVGGSFYVFSQDTDALHFKNAADSLSLEYPGSKYVRALREEAESRTRQLELRVKLQTAEQIGYPDMSLPDVNGKTVTLSDVDAKAVLVYFWSPADAEQKMFNLDVLKDIYAAYHSRGLEIFQVAIASDKPAWERVVNAQGLEWINVCDGLGQNSPVIGQYNIRKLPSCFLIVDGELSDRPVGNEKALRETLREIL